MNTNTISLFNKELLESNKLTNKVSEEYESLSNFLHHMYHHGYPKI